MAKPDTTSRYLKIADAAGLALLFGLGLVYLLEYMDTSIREPRGVLRNGVREAVRRAM